MEGDNVNDAWVIHIRALGDPCHNHKYHKDLSYATMSLVMRVDDFGMVMFCHLFFLICKVNCYAAIRVLFYL